MKKNQLFYFVLVGLLVFGSLIYSCKDFSKDNFEESAKELHLKSTAGLSYSIPVGTITDHADASIPGSVAWYLATYGGGTALSPNTFYLTSSAVYNCRSTITVPAYARITEGVGQQAVLQCDPLYWSSTSDKFVRLNTGSYLLHIEMRLNWKATIGIFADGVNDILITDITLFNSKKVSPSYLIYLTQSTNVNISGCLLRRAGMDNGEYLDLSTYLIHVIAGHDISINDNDMAVCGSSGIGFNTTYNVTINNNTIHDIGRSPTYTSDGITSYHGGTGTLNRNVYIQGNTIFNGRNHGIHVSGCGFHILSNTIYTCGTGTAASNIYVGDDKIPHDCSYGIEVNHNYLINCPAGGGSSIKRSYYKSPFYIEDNTGCTGVYSIQICG